MSAERKALWKRKFDESRTALFELLNSLSPKKWQTTVFAEGDTWTVATVLAHLVESERGMSIHVHKIRKGEATIAKDFDLERWNAGLTRRTGDVAPEELMANAAATRARTLKVMDSLDESEWELTGRHPSRGEISITQYYETIHAHEVGHLRDIREAMGE
jgi:hypothetical protein